jgi:hypothetical protein
MRTCDVYDARIAVWTWCEEESMVNGAADRAYAAPGGDAEDY